MLEFTVAASSVELRLFKTFELNDAQPLKSRIAKDDGEKDKIMEETRGIPSLQQ